MTEYGACRGAKPLCREVEGISQFLCSIPQEWGIKGVDGILKEPAAQPTSLDSRLRGTDTTKRVRGTRPFRWLGGVLLFAGKLRFARATYQVCAEGQSASGGCREFEGVPQFPYHTPNNGGSRG